VKALSDSGSSENRRTNDLRTARDIRNHGSLGRQYCQRGSIQKINERDAPLGNSPARLSSPQNNSEILAYE